ncbi:MULTISPECIES: AraC family transcriptional regulator [unclassified Nocardioides]|uniref:AraC family transcriptional regulator n=1 Tax=unclassified Nocardioides TaxID=2615069 RepID=UPI0009EFA41F|nr:MULTISPECIES: AraC family transcriptional regulator [unclassified Nocardioides]GAW49019.1 Transcriptional regulator, AraC family [Nocardioides sp. PD653-B2]GAW53175.1 Transcriptional regulator, AraC family [Nocardioides sp. PD653]
MASAAVQPAEPHAPRPSPRGGTERKTTHDPDEAEQIVTETYLPNRLLRTSSNEIDMELVTTRLGEVTAGLLSYGQTIHLQTAETTQFHVNVTLEGRGASQSGSADPLMTTRGQAIVFPVGEPAQITWSTEARHLCIMATRASLEGELEQLLGRSLPRPLAFERCLRAEVGHLWQPAIELVSQELANPQGLLTLPRVVRHLEGLVVDGLLLTQPHNYQDFLHLAAAPGRAGAIARAAELLEELPSEPWTVVRLAQEVHLSVRALQYGFKRDFDMPPMSYLKRVRLRHAHRTLLASYPESTTVSAVALEYGFLHMGRFAAAYREAFGEPPSETLRRRL